MHAYLHSSRQDHISQNSTSGWPRSNAEILAAVEQLALSGFDAAYGGRPLKRLVTKALESPLSRAILNDELHAGDTAAFVVEHERLALQIRRGDEAPG